jgi:hypothetical protein
MTDRDSLEHFTPAGWSAGMYSGSFGTPRWNKPLEHPFTRLVRCWVCHLSLHLDEAHTHHAEGCPCRALAWLPSDGHCLRLSGCGEDVHEACCPTCSIERLRRYYPGTL